MPALGNGATPQKLRPSNFHFRRFSSHGHSHALAKSSLFVDGDGVLPAGPRGAIPAGHPVHCLHGREGHETGPRQPRVWAAPALAAVGQPRPAAGGGTGGGGGQAVTPIWRTGGRTRQRVALLGA